MKPSILAGVSFILLFACSSAPVSRNPASTGSTPEELTQLLKSAGAKDKIIKPGQGNLKYDYIVPAGPYDQLFDWDMYFMGVALSYDQIGAPIASSVKDFLATVDENANQRGYTPRELAISAPWALPEMCKPFMAQAAVRASQTLGDHYEWLAEVGPESKEGENYYEKLKSMTEYWETSRQAADGLFTWYDGVESGTDDSPAVSNKPAVTTEGVDLQVYLYREYQAIAFLAQKLKPVVQRQLAKADTDEEREDLKKFMSILTSDAKTFAAKAEDLKARMIRLMWSEEDELFYNIDSRTGEKIKLKVWTSFTPLWAKMVSKDMAQKMIEHHLLLESEFWSPHGVRTLAFHEKLYDATGYWRGPIWVVSNYLMMHGLMNYGYTKPAQALAQETVDLLVDDLHKTNGMNECYNPESGEPVAGGNFVSWDLLAEHMIQESKSGNDPTSWDNSAWSAIRLFLR